jgi:DNA-binding Lrp family transcriptional regulator
MHMHAAHADQPEWRETAIRCIVAAFGNSGRKFNMISLDDVDRQLIALLRDNARTSVVTLAKQLRVARATVQNRIARLEENGVIVGYTIKVKPAAEKHRIRALMSIAVEGNQAAEVVKALRGYPNVTTIYSTNGRWDLIAELQADSLENFDRVLGAIRLITGIANTETSILLSTHKA